LEDVTVKMRALLALLLLPTVWAQELTERSTAELLRYGDILYAQGNCLSARLFYQQVLERETNHPDALLGKGQALVCEGVFDEGIATLQQVLEVAPERTEVYTRLANAYVEQYRSAPERHAEGLGEALSVLERAEAAGLEGAELLNLRGMILYRQGDLGAARDALERAVALDGAVAAYHENLGLTYLGLGDLELAVRTLRRAVTLNPDSASARNQLGSAYLLLGRCDDALFELEQAVSLAPEQLETNFNLGRALFDCGEVRAARPYFEKVVALDVTALPPAYTYLARIDLEEGNYDAAVTQATKGALLPQPNAAEAYYWLGQAYEARGWTSEDGASDAEKAREAYERALQIDSSFAPAREALN
jgi:tetratricopeptide (TPR) repeat protein